MDIKEKAAYLKGLAEGLELDKNTKEGKLIAAIIDLLGEMAEEMDSMNQDLDYVAEYAEELDQDLGEVEEYLYDEEDDEDYYDDECDGDCANCTLECGARDEDDAEEDSDK